MRFGVWDPHGNPGRRPKNRAVVVAVLLSRDCLGDKERWAQIVKSVHVFESAVDNRAAMKSAATLSKACVSSVCNKKFASERASAARTQRVHGYSTEWSRTRRRLRRLPSVQSDLSHQNPSAEPRAELCMSKQGL